MRARIVKEIDRILNKYKKYDDDLFVHQIDHFFRTYETPQREMQEIYTGLKESANLANELHCCILSCNNIALDNHVVSMLQDTTRFLENYHVNYDPQFGFTRYRNPSLRCNGETSYDDIITRHFTPPRRIQQADEEMVILWHDLRHVLMILADTKEILSCKRKRPKASPPPLQV